MLVRRRGRAWWCRRDAERLTPLAVISTAATDPCILWARAATQAESLPEHGLAHPRTATWSEPRPLFSPAVDPANPDLCAIVSGGDFALFRCGKWPG
jgi:hypothetical protein